MPITISDSDLEAALLKWGEVQVMPLLSKKAAAIGLMRREMVREGFLSAPGSTSGADNSGPEPRKSLQPKPLPDAPAVLPDASDGSTPTGDIEAPAA